VHIVRRIRLGDCKGST